jgi:Transposase domain (DUF772)
MFKKTSKEYQLGLFSSAESFLDGKTKKYYNDEMAWHNLFRQYVCMQIDENIFSVLFSGGKGAPNASIRVMISMMVIKEAYGWSDAQLFEQCRFNLLVRSAIGLFNMNDDVPVESTYYLFRKRVVEYERSQGENLIEKAFASVTQSQAVEFEVSGKKVRMDSKLLGSNIAWCSRYELVHESVKLFWKEQGSSLQKDMEPQMIEQLDAILQGKGTKIVYTHTKDELKIKLQELGILIFKLLQLPSLIASKKQKTLSLVFAQQFKLEQETVLLRAKEEIQTDSVQSPHDTDCHYRNKDGNQVKGYSINITESCSDDQLNLISYVDVRPASEADCHFFQEAINVCEEIFVDEVESVNADGAYHSPENQEFCKKKEIDFYLPNIQGMAGRYDLSLNENNELVVYDTKISEFLPATKMENKEKWRIKTDKGYRYFTHKELEVCLLRKKLSEIPIEILNMRNNVEASIFQLGYHYPNDKSRYRGLSKHKMWANIRCLWVNFVRILNYLKQICQRASFLPKMAFKNAFEVLFFEYISLLNLFILFYTFAPSKK